jgi:hypothetical protein
MNTEEKQEYIHSVLGHTLITGSKGRYRHNHPLHIAVFNANICQEVDGVEVDLHKTDIDITLSLDKLKEIANKIGTVWVCFENHTAIDRAVVVVHPKQFNSPNDNKIIYNEEYYEFYNHILQGQLVNIVRESEDEQIKPIREADQNQFIEVPFVKSKITIKEDGKWYLDMEKIRNQTKSDKCPLVVLNDYLEAAGHKMIEVYINSSDYEHIETMYKSYLAFHNPFYSEYDINKAVMWTFFGSAPMTLDYRNDWVQPNCFYIRVKTDKIETE